MCLTMCHRCKFTPHPLSLIEPELKNSSSPHCETSKKKPHCCTSIIKKYSVLDNNCNKSIHIDNRLEYSCRRSQCGDRHILKFVDESVIVTLPQEGEWSRVVNVFVTWGLHLKLNVTQTENIKSFHGEHHQRTKGGGCAKLPETNQ